MKRSKGDLIQYRIQKCDRAFKAAAGLADLEDYDGAINRLYYSAFYAISAALLNYDIIVKSHSGVKSKFHELIIKPNKVDSKSGKLFNQLFDNRHDADYSDFVVFTKENVDDLIQRTKEFISEIKLLIFNETE